MQSPKNKYPSVIAILVLVILHVVGLIGLNGSSWSGTFQTLVPINLIITAIAVFAFHKNWNIKFFGFILSTMVAGFAVESLGVATGQIFGSYQYGETLGFKLLEVPVMIGLNWVLLIYCTGIISARLAISGFSRILIGATLMMVIDIFIEPFAIIYGLWSWESSAVPVQNYIAWFVISFVLHFCFQKLVDHKKNLVAQMAFIIMFLFFVIDYLINN